MDQVRLQARERLGLADERDGEVYAQVKKVFQAAHEALSPGTPFYPQVLGLEDDWEVPSALGWGTHRGRIGALIVWVKKRILFPLNRWLYSYTWHNLHRQQKLNVLLLSAVESLAVSHARLRQEIDELRPRAPQAIPPKATERPAKEPRPRSKDSEPLKLAFVVDRYGADVPGGSERHCREFAERLAGRGHEVTVLTSCARDYVTWANVFPPGRPGMVR